MTTLSVIKGPIIVSKLILKLIGACAVALSLSACATSNNGNISETTATAEALPIADSKPVEAPVPNAKPDTKQTENKTDKKDPNRRICKRQKVPGSNLKKKICASAARWDEEEEKARKFLDGVQKNNRSRGSGN